MRGGFVAFFREMKTRMTERDPRKIDVARRIGASGKDI